MKRYVLFVGGGGARAAEALLVAASAGVLRAETIEVLLADADHHGLNSAELLRAKYADYARMQETLPGGSAPEDLCPFHTMLNFRAWPAELPGGAQTLEEMVQARETDALLCQALFGAEAAQMDLRGGFHGQRTLGQTVFAALLAASAENAEDELQRMLADMNAALDAGEEVRVALCGSVTGGTGAAGLPLLARHVRDVTGGRARIGAVLLAATGDHEDAQKAREAIADFAGESACSAVCLLGLPRSSCSAAPANYAHLTDWLAVYSLDIMLHRPIWPEGLFTVQTDVGPLTWDIFGKAAARYRLGYGRLAKAAAAWTQIIAPQVEKRLNRPFFLRDSLWGWYAHFFRKSGCEKAVCLEDTVSMTRLMRVALIWLGGLMHTLPPEMSHHHQLAPAQAEAREHYCGLVELVGQLTVLDEEAQQSVAYEESRVYRDDAGESASESAQTVRRIDAIRQEIDRRTAAQQGMNRRIGGAAAMRIMQHALLDAQEESAALQERYREANRRIDHAESIAAPQDLYRITDARTKLERMVRHQQLLDAKESFITEAVRRAEGDEVRFAKPEITGAGAGNGMLHARMLDKLLLQERRVRASEVEAAYPEMVQPADGRPLKATLKRIRKAPVNEYAPVMSLLTALIREAMEEV